MNTGIESTWSVLPHHIFVIGDNSKNSRELGSIPLDYTLEKILI
ncbi:hypothetical protein COE09_17435 [Bacillus thuringiensis]|nr:hypothetical protein COE09_17435 [Bacillus thuringiensis]